jgi:hypothetical protein
LNWLRLSTVALLLPLAGAGIQAAHEAPTLRAFTYDLAGLPPGVLARAHEVADRVFHAAGLELRWCTYNRAGVLEDSPEPCRGPLAHSDLALRILPRRERELRFLASGATEHYEILGHAICVAGGEGKYVSIYWKSLLRMAGTSEARVALLLGYTIAHEIGHLLLGDHTTGIMASDWAGKDVIAAPEHEFLFSVSDSRRLVKRAWERLAADKAAAKR